MNAAAAVVNSGAGAPLAPLTRSWPTPGM
jgi:hypothetical protein